MRNKLISKKNALRNRTLTYQVGELKRYNDKICHFLKQEIAQIAERLGCTTSQLAIAWYHTDTDFKFSFSKCSSGVYRTVGPLKMSTYTMSLLEQVIKCTFDLQIRKHT